MISQQLLQALRKCASDGGQHQLSLTSGEAETILADIELVVALEKLRDEHKARTVRPVNRDVVAQFCRGLAQRLDAHEWGLIDADVFRYISGELTAENVGGDQQVWVETLRDALSATIGELLLESTRNSARDVLDDVEDSFQKDLEFLRNAGWTVAVHNDYRQDGKSHTFWLFTKGERAVKGEGATDAEALREVREVIHGQTPLRPGYHWVHNGLCWEIVYIPDDSDVAFRVGGPLHHAERWGPFLYPPPAPEPYDTRGELPPPEERGWYWARATRAADWRPVFVSSELGVYGFFLRRQQPFSRSRVHQWGPRIMPPEEDSSEEDGDE